MIENGSVLFNQHWRAISGIQYERDDEKRERDQVKWGELKITVAMWAEEGEDIFCSLVPRISPGQTGL